MGMIAGLVLAFTYRSIGPQRKVYEWPEEEDEDESNDQDNNSPQNTFTINYTPKEQSPDKD